jgi:prepilin peptidase CpaA
MTTLWNESLMPLQWSAVICASLLAALWDLHSRRIPNWLCVAVWLGGLIWAVSVGGWAALGDGLLGCLLMMVPFVLLFLLAGGGAGDAKFMGALGMWLGVTNGLVALVCVVLAGGVIAIGMSLTQKRLGIVLQNVVVLFTATTYALTSPGRWKQLTDVPKITAQPMQTMPYAVAIFTGVCLAAGGLYLWRM